MSAPTIYVTAAGHSTLKAELKRMVKLHLTALRDQLDRAIADIPADVPQDRRGTPTILDAGYDRTNEILTLLEKSQDLLGTFSYAAKPDTTALGRLQTSLARRIQDADGTNDAFMLLGAEAEFCIRLLGPQADGLFQERDEVTWTESGTTYSGRIANISIYPQGGSCVISDPSAHDAFGHSRHPARAFAIVPLTAIKHREHDFY